MQLLKSDGTTAVKIYDTGNTEFNQPALFHGNMTVNGTTTNVNDLNVYGSLYAFKGPWYCAGRINTGTGSISTNYGRVSFTVVRDAQASVTITMAAAHPQGSGYAVFASSARPFTTVENNSSGLGVRTSTSFQIVLRNADFSTLASDTNGLTFMVV
jgi:hypothetical protein